MLTNLAQLIDLYAPRYAWALLLFAGGFEIAWVWTLKLSEGYTRLGPTLLTIPLALCSTGLLALAMKGLPMGTAYAVWVGIGAVGATILGITLFGEQPDIYRLACMGLIVAGVVGLKLGSALGG
jgi:quaternary ammonium compound-resistance protein SugE